MAKLTLNDVADLTQPTTAKTTINNNSAAIETAMENTFSRDGTSPNTIACNIDMDSNRVLNLPEPVTANEPLRLQDLEDFIGGGTIASIPAGGTTLQVLAKTSGTDYAIAWTDDSSLITAGTNIVKTGTSPTTISTSLTPGFTSVNTNTLNASSVVNLSGLTASSAVATDGSKNLVSVTNTGSGSNVLATSPTLVTPVLGAATGTSLNLAGLTVSSAVATDGSKNLVSVTNTGSGNNVLATSPTLVTPILGTPTSGTLTNCTLPVGGITGLGTGVGTFLATPSSANLISAVTDETGSGSLVFATSPTLVTPTLGSATATQITFNPTTGGIVGTPTNNSAGAGFVGEYIESILVSGSATGLTTGTDKTVTSISLTAGDWDVDCNLVYIPNAATSISRYSVALSLTTNTFDSTAGRFSQTVIPATVLGAFNLSIPVPAYRFSLSGTTSIFMVANAAFTVNTLAAWGIIRARRIR